jgi:hypothetical protein
MVHRKQRQSEDKARRRGNELQEDSARHTAARHRHVASEGKSTITIFSDSVSSHAIVLYEIVLFLRVMNRKIVF